MSDRSSFPMRKKWVWPLVSSFGYLFEIFGKQTAASGQTPMIFTPRRIANFSISVPIPESITIEPVFYAARATPAIVFPARFDIAPARRSTGVGYTNLSLSAISLIRKSLCPGSVILMSFAGRPMGICMSCKVQSSPDSAPFFYSVINVLRNTSWNFASSLSFSTSISCCSAAVCSASTISAPAALSEAAIRDPLLLEAVSSLIGRAWLSELGAPILAPCSYNLVGAGDTNCVESCFPISVFW